MTDLNYKPAMPIDNARNEQKPRITVEEMLAFAKSNSSSTKYAKVNQKPTAGVTVKPKNAHKARKNKRAPDVGNSQFEESLFVGDNIDYDNYVEYPVLMGLLQNQVKGIVEKDYETYQKSLLRVLQHCYGYMYALKHDSDRYVSDIKNIDAAIASMNLNSNKGNALHVKIIKLAWKGTKISRSRVSTYAHVLENAWKCGEYKEGTTDNKGHILPSQFIKQVMVYGGIQSFSRCTVKELMAAQELANEGYASRRDKKIDMMRNMVATGEVKILGSEVINQHVEITLPSLDIYENDRDGSLSLMLCRWDKKESKVISAYKFQEEKDAKLLEDSLVALYDMMQKAKSESLKRAL